MAVRVRDEGAGIPLEEQAHIFERFRRGAAVDRGIAGMGLGLYIAREVAAAHGGTIDVTSSAEAGTVFTVRLPRRRVTGTA